MLEYKYLKTVKNGREYTDIVVVIDGHDFILKPASFYSQKCSAFYFYLLSKEKSIVHEEE